MSKLLILLLMTTNIIAQEFIDSSSFESKTAKGITVIEFWAEWNKSNEVTFLSSLKGGDAFKICIAKNADVTSKFKVVSIPTIIILENGIEQARFNPNIMMQLPVTKKEVQKIIDNITLSKFQ